MTDPRDLLMLAVIVGIALAYTIWALWPILASRVHNVRAEAPQETSPDVHISVGGLSGSEIGAHWFTHVE